MILSLELMPPGKMTADILGGGVEGGRNLQGYPQSVDFSGSGIVVIKYSMIKPSNRHTSALRYLSRLGAMLNGGVQTIDVPMLVDFITPVAGDGIPSALLAAGAEFSDGSTFGDNSEYAASLVSGNLASTADLNAGTVELRVINGREIVGGEWFSIYHEGRGHRAYRISQVDDAVADGGNMIYTVGIRPTLREAAPVGIECRLVRPRCKMRLAPGSSIPFDVERWWESSAELNFIEAA